MYDAGSAVCVKVRVTVGFGLMFGLTNESAFSGFRTHERLCSR